jgi:nicotinamidase-related amidase
MSQITGRPHPGGRHQPFRVSGRTRILSQALPIALRLAVLEQRVRKAGIPCIYVNDNFGQWRSDASKLVTYCLRPESAGRKFVEEVRPDPDDYFVLKPMHSAFFQTPLERVVLQLWRIQLLVRW